MPFSVEFRDHVLDLLAPLGVRARSMFGGVGFFADDRMFALIAEDRLYFKVDEVNRPDYEAAGSAPWVYEAPGGRRMPMPYWAVPEQLLDGAGEIQSWAARSIDAAHRAEVARGPRGKGRKRPASGSGGARPRLSRPGKKR